MMTDQCWVVRGHYEEDGELYETHVLAPIRWDREAVRTALIHRSQEEDHFITAEMLQYAELTPVQHQMIDGALYVLVGSEVPLSDAPPV